MAIAKIKHIDIFFTKQQKEKIIYLLQKLGAVQLIQIKEAHIAAQKEEATEGLGQLQEAIDYLESLSLKKGFFSEKPVLGESQIEELLKEFDIGLIIRHLNALRERIKSTQIELDKLHSTKYNLLPWEKLRLSLTQVAATEHIELIPGIINRNQLTSFDEEIKSKKLNLYFETINQKDNLVYLLIIYLKQESQIIHPLLKKYNFNPVILPKIQGAPSQIILETEANIAKLNEEKQELWQEARRILPEKIKLMALADKLSNEDIRRGISGSIFQTDYVSLVTGWIKEKDLGRLKSCLSSFVDLEVVIRDPEPDEEPPVTLENKRLIQPFEFITKIYGMPKYNEIDPTPFLAPFFFLYFGFCVSDVGYGLMLTLICWFALKKFKMGPQGLRFFRLFLFCGISTIIIGALTGSWFGNLFDLLADTNKVFLPLKRFKDSLILLDPLKEPTKLLGIALSFGIVQVWFGNIVAAIGNIKNKRYLDIALDQVPMLTLLFGLTGLGLIFLKLLDASRISLFKYATLLASIALISTQGRTQKGISTKLFYGLYNLYSALSGYLSDILSYSRLWALGLVTGVMATTVNLISVQFSQIFTSIIPFINNVSFIKVLVSGFILAAIFIFGHVVSFLMNLLGAFVHPVRLQFVEFFSKFFKSGGISFKPLKVETKYINTH
ncbi:MAG: hypothetical protein COX40_05805 [Candidatus Omnitrophica bacterium CG23_combo_of_CG06-09_8_20_14_all_40_11]|nr:MAG: hypothetical protein COX40_05805 [Candidatus Omnitrophica bacterium CG23_combo_of_CG06-09_8_20_14_all_40_11]